MKLTEFLDQRSCWYERVPHFPTYSAQRLAHELHVSGREVAKTVLLRSGELGNYEYVVAVLPANKQIDFDRLEEVLDLGEVQLANEVEIAEHCPDFEFGVLPPFGSHFQMKTIVDASLTEDEEIWFEGNTHEEAICMKFADYERIEKPQIADFAVGENDV